MHLPTPQQPQAAPPTALQTAALIYSAHRQPQVAAAAVAAAHLIRFKNNH